MSRYYSATASISLLALALAGCNKSAQDTTAATASPSASASPDSGLPALPAALPMQTGPASQVTTAPPVSALPTRRYVGVARPANDREGYAYLDRASDIEDEVGDAPPDYEYHNDDGVSPYVWQTGGGDYRYAEPVDGGYRYYYYQRGAQYPYLVRTNNYSYAYAGGALVAVYALSGALLSPDQYGGYRDDASRYFWRGQHLRQYNDQSQHQGVNAANWAAQRAQFSAAQANWAADRAQQSAWQAYHAQNDPSQRPGWQQEHQQRQQVAQQFSGWQSRGFSGSPPPALAASGARGGGQHGYAGQYPAPVQNGAGREMAGPQGGAPFGGRNPNAPAAARQQQPEAQPQAPNGKAMTQQAKDAQRAADLRQQAANRAQHQQDVAAQQVRAGEAQQRATQEREVQQRQVQQHEAQQRELQQRQVQQHEAQQHEVQQRELQQHESQASAHQAQLHAQTARHQAEAAKMEESRVRPEAAGREHPQPVPAPRERAPEAQRPREAPQAPEKPAAHEAPHADQPHPEPGHEHEHEHEHQ